MALYEPMQDAAVRRSKAIEQREAEQLIRVQQQLNVRLKAACLRSWWDLSRSQGLPKPLAQPSPDRDGAASKRSPYSELQQSAAERHTEAPSQARPSHARRR